MQVPALQYWSSYNEIMYIQQYIQQITTTKYAGYKTKYSAFGKILFRIIQLGT
jgi:hypothetical protein